MIRFHKLLPALALGLVSLAAPVFPFQYNDTRYGDQYGDMRGVVERTQSDLREASQLSRKKGDERSRYENAQRHLSTFDRHLVKGKFDKGEMNDAISNVQKIIDKNTLQASSRDALMRDISDLRSVRANR